MSAPAEFKTTLDIIMSTLLFLPLAAVVVLHAASMGMRKYVCR
jgi:hypothetical protein